LLLQLMSQAMWNNNLYRRSDGEVLAVLVLTCLALQSFG
jgi:hypothetical protein